ncbi:MAG: C2H2-type zinc finger protein [Endozoicomonadaceae bacterium]|nr:C2H2-type zinc finger protein [Endozoicomonadaceae bacterium]
MNSTDEVNGISKPTVGLPVDFDNRLRSSSKNTSSIPSGHFEGDQYPQFSNNGVFSGRAIYSTSNNLIPLRSSRVAPDTGSKTSTVSCLVDPANRLGASPSFESSLMDSGRSVSNRSVVNPYSQVAEWTEIFSDIQTYNSATGDESTANTDPSISAPSHAAELANCPIQGILAEEKYFRCDICFRVYKYQCHFTKHLIEHESEVGACDICGKVYQHKSSLVEHLKLHTEIGKPCLCDLCGKRFRTLFHLKEHLKTHTGERPFMCNICFKRFKQRSHLTRHVIKLHHDQNTQH